MSKDLSNYIKLLLCTVRITPRAESPLFDRTVLLMTICGFAAKEIDSSESLWYVLYVSKPLSFKPTYCMYFARCVKLSLYVTPVRQLTGQIRTGHVILF